MFFKRTSDPRLVIEIVESEVASYPQAGLFAWEPAAEVEYLTRDQGLSLAAQKDVFKPAPGLTVLELQALEDKQIAAHVARQLAEDEAVQDRLEDEAAAVAAKFEAERAENLGASEEVVEDVEDLLGDTEDEDDTEVVEEVVPAKK